MNVMFAGGCLKSPHSDGNDLRERIKRARIVFFDVDGVFYPGTVLVTENGEYAKERSLVDGQGLSFLRALGLQIVFVTGEKDTFIAPVLKKLNELPSVKAGKWPPIIASVEKIGDQKLEFCQKCLNDPNFVKDGATWANCIYMGDDIGDVRAMQQIANNGGLVVVPSQAEMIVEDIAHLQTARDGGRGAIRDLADCVLEVWGVNPLDLDLK